MRITRRAQNIQPFYVMEVAKAAAALAKSANSGDSAMIYLNIGEPDFGAPPLVQAAAARAISQGHTRYTDALGLDALRERISAWYASRHGINISAKRIVVTAGASSALHLACLALIERGDEVLMPDPCYPCNRQFVQAADGRAVLLPTTAASRFQLTADQVRDNWGAQTRGVLLASPSNPTGTSIASTELAKIIQTVESAGGVSLIDEIYLGLSFEAEFGQTALALSDQVISINSFSKYFGMTGWRLGWLVVPEELVAPIERLAQNLFICPSTISQHAALACFETESLTEYERRRADFKARRDYFVSGLASVGLDVPVMPDGAFYAYADCTELARRLGVTGSWDLSFELMRRFRLAVTPGRDFGVAAPEQYLRFSTATRMDLLAETLDRLRAI